MTYAPIAVGLEFHHPLQVDVHIVLTGPDGIGIVGRGVPRSELQRQLVFVVVARIVTSQAHEEHHVVVLHLVGGILLLGVDEHLHVPILAQVIARGAVDGACIAAGKPIHIQRYRLLVELGVAVAGGVPLLALYTGRQDVGHRLARTVLFDIDSRNVEGRIFRRTRGIVARLEEVLRVLAPCGIDKVQCGETQDDRLLELIEEHPHKADGLVAVDIAHLLVGLTDGNTELVPLAAGILAIGQLHIACLLNVDDVVLAYHHTVGTEVDHILVVVLGLAQRVVLVDVLHIGIGRCRGHIVLLAILFHRRVALGVVVLLVAVGDFYVVLVVEGGAEIAEIVVRRIKQRLPVGLRLGAVAGRNRLQVGCKERLLIPQPVGRPQAVVSHILVHARSGVIVEGVDNRLGVGHTPPYGGVHPCHLGRGREAILETLASVAKDVLADIAQVDVQLASRVVGILDERIHQPKLNRLDILCLEVGVVQLAHDAAPAAGGVE